MDEDRPFDLIHVPPEGLVERRPSRLRVLFASPYNYLDDSNGASVASRAFMETLARHGVDVEVLCMLALDAIEGHDPVQWLGNRGFLSGRPGAESWTIDTSANSVNHLNLVFKQVSITILFGRSSRFDEPEEPAATEFIHLFRSLSLVRRPDVVVGYGGSRMMDDIFAMARSMGSVTTFGLHNFAYRHRGPFTNVDNVIVASKFASDYYREALGLSTVVLPYLIDYGRTRHDGAAPRYLTFVNPSIEKGVYAFARIADELGRRRPEIPILVVESRGTEATVAACGLELREHGNVFFMGHTHDPRDFWGVTKVCLLPSLWWENQPLVAVEAMVNGIPVIGSDRGGIPETLGAAGIVLPLPDRITQATRMLPTAEEVEPWVQAVIRLWDDADFYEEHGRRAMAEAHRWDPEVLEPQYVEFFRNLKPGSKPDPGIPPGRAKAVVLVPHLGTIEPECEDSLRKLEAAGVRVVRSGGNSAIDVAQNRLTSGALHDGAESLLFVDSDLGFDPLDALRLLARPEPVVSGVYAKKGRREFASVFADGVEEVVIGVHAFGLYPLKYAATGFLRIKASVLRRMIAELDLPHCNRKWGRGEWPFFQPTVVPQGEGEHHYLGEDWAFSHRLSRIGVTPMADTPIRLWHYGRHPFGWEDAGAESKRFATHTYRPGGREG